MESTPKISFLPFQACPAGKIIQSSSLVLNPLSWPLTALYFSNYQKLKKLTKDNQDLQKYKDRSYKILIATYATHIVFFLAANAAAAYCLSSFAIKADRNTSIYSTALYVSALALLGMAFAFTKWQAWKKEKHNQKSTTIKSSAYFLMNMSLGVTGPLVIVSQIIAIPPTIYFHCTGKFHTNHQNQCPLVVLENEVNSFKETAHLQNDTHINALNMILQAINKKKVNQGNPEVTIQSLRGLFEGVKENYPTTIINPTDVKQELSTAEQVPK